MKRANLLLTDQSSSGSKMTTTGLSTPSGSTRTKAAKGLFSHFMFLASLLLIALLTSGKALALEEEPVNVTIITESSHLEVNPATIAQGTGASRVIALSVADDAYKLPAAKGVTVTIGTSPLEEGDGDDNFSYNAENGKITLGADVNINGEVKIGATAVEKSSDNTLSALKYSHESISSGVEQTITDFDQATIGDVELAYNSALIENELTITATPTNDFATVEVIGNTSIKVGENTVVVTVTAENKETKTYTVKFIMAQDALSGITVPDAFSGGLTLSKKVTAVDDVLAILKSDHNKFATTTKGGQAPNLEVAWSLKSGEEFNPAADQTNDFTWAIEAATLEAANLADGGVELTGNVTITNAPANTRLKTLTYTIDDVTKDVADLTDQAGGQTYEVALDATIAPDATITITAEAEDKDVTVTGNTSLTLSNNQTTTKLTIGTRTVTINFTRTPSDDATLQALTYKVGQDGEETSVPSFGATTNSYTVSLPYDTEAKANISVTPTPTNQYATYKVDAAQPNIPDDASLLAAEPLKVTLDGGKATLDFTVTAENALATQKVKIEFTTAKEKIVSIAAPEAPVLEAAKDEAEVLTEVQKIKNVTATPESGTPVLLDVTWKLKDQTKFTAVAGAKNTYTWTVTDQEVYDLNGHTTGEMEVVNYAEAKTGNLSEEDLTISDEKGLYTQIGEENGDKTTIKSVTVDSELDKLNVSNATVSNDMTINAAVGALNFNKATVTGVLSIDAAVEEISFTDATISSELNVTDAATGLSVVVTGNTDIAQITNAGKLTLNDAAGVTPLSLAVDTKAAAALENKGAVKAVANSGTFTDNTASIVTVTGNAALSITSLPKKQSTYGEEVTLAVAATGESITYQWEKNNNGKWESAKGTGNDDATLTVNKSEDGAGSFRCKVISKKSGATTTLYTPAVTVAFLTESGPSEPSNPSTPTYTVLLDKVAGATFSKGETTTVDEGGSFSFTITLDKDYDQSKPVVTVNGKALEADTDGNYTIKNIREDMEIVVTGIVKNTATGTEDITADSTRAWSEGSTLHIHAQNAATAYIFTATGALQQQLQVAGDQTVQLHAGFYIVRIGNYTAKVIIR